MFSGPYETSSDNTGRVRSVLGVACPRTRVEPTLLKVIEFHTRSALCWEPGMPSYEFYCRECKKSVPQVLKLVDYEEGDIACPHCGSRQVEQRWSVFYAITSKKSA